MELQAVIGLEIHAQINTQTKMFCRCSNDSFGKRANINICPVCMGFPGQLPVLNKSAVEKGVKAALALNCKINEFSKFDRKNYFYPDSPKNFQISQYDEPVSEKGYVDVEITDENYKESDGDKKFKVRIHRLHLEDDAGKMTHVSDGSLLDFNRAGTPLMEIVTEPDMHSAKQAAALAKEVQKIVRYVGSSDADMEKGMMRFDASVSLRPMGEDKLYPRAEIKNLNSFKALEAAIKYEIKRQEKLWKEGKPLDSPETVGWDDEKGKTFFMRGKEDSDDYRYFPEPDIPPVVLSSKLIEEFKAEIPELPHVKKEKYIEDFGIGEDDARILSDDLKLAQYFEEVVAISGDAKLAASFVNTILMKYLNEELIEIDQQKVTAEMMGDLLKLVVDGEISNNVAKGEVFEEMYDTGKSAAEIVKAKGLKQVNDTDLIEGICERVIAGHPGPVADVRGGKDKAIGFLVGMVMKESKGQANPKIVNDILQKLINK